jgi:hypothetical protein
VPFVGELWNIISLEDGTTDLLDHDTRLTVRAGLLAGPKFVTGHCNFLGYRNTVTHPLGVSVSKKQNQQVTAYPPNQNAQKNVERGELVH